MRIGLFIKSTFILFNCQCKNKNYFSVCLSIETKKKRQAGFISK